MQLSWLKISSKELLYTYIHEVIYVITGNYKMYISSARINQLYMSTEVRLRFVQQFSGMHAGFLTVTATAVIDTYKNNSVKHATIAINNYYVLTHGRMHVQHYII